MPMPVSVTEKHQITGADICPHFQFDPAFFRREFDGVVQQIYKYLFQPFHVPQVPGLSSEVE